MPLDPWRVLWTSPINERHDGFDKNQYELGSRHRRRQMKRRLDAAPLMERVIQLAPCGSMHISLNSVRLLPLP